MGWRGEMMIGWRVLVPRPGPGPGLGLGVRWKGTGMGAVPGRGRHHLLLLGRGVAIVGISSVAGGSSLIAHLLLPVSDEINKKKHDIHYIKV